MSTYLLAYLGTGTFRYLPYIYFNGGGDIIVREYGQPEAVLPQSDFDPDAYHLYEVVYDPAVTDEAGCTSRGFAANCAATLYVDGTDQGVYYPYRFPGNVDSTAALQWGSGSSGGQAHLRYNMLHFQLLVSATTLSALSVLPRSWSWPSDPFDAAAHRTTAAAKTTSNSLWATARVAPGMCLGALLRQCRAVLFRLFCCSSVQSANVHSICSSRL